MNLYCVLPLSWQAFPLHALRENFSLSYRALNHLPWRHRYSAHVFWDIVTPKTNTADRKTTELKTGPFRSRKSSLTVSMCVFGCAGHEGLLQQLKIWHRKSSSCKCICSKKHLGALDEDRCPCKRTKLGISRCYHDQALPVWRCQPHDHQSSAFITQATLDTPATLPHCTSWVQK